MKLWKIFLKTLIEQLREWPSLSMVLVLCPFFVFLYWLMSSGGSTTYKILLLNQDKGIHSENLFINEGEQVAQILQKMQYPNHLPMTKVESLTDRTLASEILKNRNAAALLIVPEDFSQTLHSIPVKKQTEQTAVTIVGDAANPAYTVASILALTAADQVIQKVSGIKPSVTWNEEFISGRSPRTEFEMYVPGLLILSIMMLIFTTALPLVREREDKTLRRLRLSCLNSFELLGGVSLAQIVIGTSAILLTFLSARLLGFHSEGSFWLAIFIGVLTAGSAIAVGLITACFCKNATAVLTIGTLPFFLFMWFTGAAMPLPRIELFTIYSRNFAINDLLPPTQAVIALNKVLSFGASLSDVWFEISLMLVLSAIYFIIGVIIFQKTQMQKQ
jgi:ABC-2 type transport system permease protein